MPEFKCNNGIILGIKKLGERNYIASILTDNNGRYCGVFNTHHPPQIGDIVSARWQARLSEQMGRFYIENCQSIAGLFLDDWLRLSCLKSVCELLNHSLPERQNYPQLYQKTYEFITTLNDDNYLQKYIFFELNLLSELGFGLDLTHCACGGNDNDLAYVSPKTGRAVSREKAEPYKNKLIPLPEFLYKKAPITQNDLRNALKLTGYFLQKNVLTCPLPESRNYLLKNK